MNIEEMLDMLRRRYPAFGRKVIYDKDHKGREFAEIVYPNEKNPSMPITVSVSDDGCLISAGQISHVTGERPISIPEAISAIDDIINDRIVFVLGYEDKKDSISGAPFLTELFALTGDENDERGELDEFIAKLRTPVKGLRRYFASLKGRFVVTNFSGTINEEIFR